MLTAVSLWQTCHSHEDGCCQKCENNATDLQTFFWALLWQRLHSKHLVAVPSTFVYAAVLHNQLEARMQRKLSMFPHLVRSYGLPLHPEHTSRCLQQETVVSLYQKTVQTTQQESTLFQEKRLL